MALNKNALKYKQSEARTYGLATVKVGKSKVKVTFKDGDSYTFPNDSDYLPKRPRLATDTEDIYMVVLTPDKDAIEKIGPSEGHVLAKVTDFSRPDEDSDPEPIDATYIDKKTHEESHYQKFTAFFTVQSGKYKGCVIPHFLRYKFADDGDGYAMWNGNPSAPNAVHLPRLEEFCIKVGCVEEPIEWPEDGNILPELLRRALKADRTVELIIKDGYINTILSKEYEDADEDDVDDVSEDDDEEEVTPKSKKFKATDAPKQKSYTTKAKDYEDADEDEEPAPAKKTTGKVHKSKPASDDDEDDDF